MLDEKVKRIINSQINKYRNLSKDTEFELRIGKIIHQEGKYRFDPNLPSNYFKEVSNRLGKSNDFINKRIEVFYEQRKGSTRVRYDQKKNQIDSVKKKRKSDKQLSITNSQWDIRLSFSKEKESDKILHFNKKKAIRKKRTTYYYSYTVVDMTITNRGKYNNYQIELELVENHLVEKELRYASNEVVNILEQMLFE